VANTRIISLAEVSASVATLTLNSSSTIGINDFIRVSTNNSAYNGIFNVSACPSSTQISYPLNSANLSPAAVSGSVEYIAYDSTGRPAYMYDVETNKWIEIAGKIDTGKNYTFSGYNIFNSTTVFRGPTIINSASGAVGLEINAASGQSSNLIQVDNNSGSTMFAVKSDGKLSFNETHVSASANAVVGYLTVEIGGNSYKIPYHS
jgi:hypothetical protein